MTARRVCIQNFQRFASTTSSSFRKPQYNYSWLKNYSNDLQHYVDRRRVKLPHGQTIDEILSSYRTLAGLRQSQNDLKHKRKRIEIEAKDSKSGDLFKQLKALKSEIQQLEKDIDLLEPAVSAAIEAIPNEIAPGVTDKEQILKVINPDKETDSDESRDHLGIASNLGLLDVSSAALISGSSFYYLLNDGALLEQALIQYGLKKAREHGFTMITPPSVVRQEASVRCGFKPRDQSNEQQVYTLDSGDLCLTGTAEIPLAGWAAQKTLDLSKGPLKRVGVSRSYRAEAGAGGKDTKGLYRVHEFTKVELFCWTKNSKEESGALLDDLLELQMEIVEELGLCARVLNMPEHDLGAPAYKKYDIEAWMPGRGNWGEITSASNCLDYQTRRLLTKYAVGDGTTEFAHTLNGTAIAVPRLLIAIIENYFDKELNRITIPEVLRPWMDDRTHIVQS